jgi:hypothetical protein
MYVIIANRPKRSRLFPAHLRLRLFRSEDGRTEFLDLHDPQRPRMGLTVGADRIVIEDRRRRPRRRPQSRPPRQRR